MLFCNGCSKQHRNRSRNQNRKKVMSMDIKQDMVMLQLRQVFQVSSMRWTWKGRNERTSYTAPLRSFYYCLPVASCYGYNTYDRTGNTIQRVMKICFCTLQDVGQDTKTLYCTGVANSAQERYIMYY